MPSRTPTEHLLHRLSDEARVDVPEGTTVHRTYAGRLQRQAGAWSWFALRPDGREVCGSHYSVVALLKAKSLVAAVDKYTGFVCVDPGGLDPAEERS